MRVVFPLFLLSFLSTVLAQGNLTGLFDTLQGTGLGKFVDALKSLNGTETGGQVLGVLSDPGQNLTLFAPNDISCACVLVAFIDIAKCYGSHRTPSEYQS